MKENKIYLQWLLIQDLIGPVNLWPKCTRRLFWIKHIKHWDRIMLTSFAYVNGLDIECLCQWGDMIGFFRNAAAKQHVMLAATDKLFTITMFQTQDMNILMEQ